MNFERILNFKHVRVFTIATANRSISNFLEWKLTITIMEWDIEIFQMNSISPSVIAMPSFQNWKLYDLTAYFTLTGRLLKLSDDQLQSFVESHSLPENSFRRICKQLEQEWTFRTPKKIPLLNSSLVKYHLLIAPTQEVYLYTVCQKHFYFKLFNFVKGF